VLFNRYRYLREIGQGGMGRVILARDEVLAIDVALKLVPEEVVRDIGGLRDLKREVLRGMALSHPNIVRVHSFEQDATHGAIVMEYVNGDTLADAKEHQPFGCFDHETLRPWLEQLCSVLDHAHREVKIAHRDLKPRNILLTPERKIKVADFGISCSLADTVHRLTTHIDPSGTPPYMSPQQAMGETPSHLDDIYSLGATLYDLLTGKPPFYRGNVVMQALQQHAPSVAQRRMELGRDLPPIPQAWENVIAACLAKTPSERPGSGQEILAALQSPAPIVRVGSAARSPLESTAPAPHSGGVTTVAKLSAPPRAKRRWRHGGAGTERETTRGRNRSGMLFAVVSLVLSAVVAGALAAAIWSGVRTLGARSMQRGPEASAGAQVQPATPSGSPSAPAQTEADRFDSFNRSNRLEPSHGLNPPGPDTQRPSAPPPRRGPR
jgi:serine/threonine protein kinase